MPYNDNAITRAVNSNTCLVSGASGPKQVSDVAIHVGARSRWRWRRVLTARVLRLARSCSWG
eukprot:scaffold124674_cov32-Tisochrysis_lutea.AAC.1